ncbi:MAG: DinB family protein [Ignavibacteria bacterium]
MEIKTKSTRMYSIITLFDMHTNFFQKAIDGISEKDSHNRLNTKANHVEWLAGSMVQERFELAGTLGKEMKQKAYEMFKDHQGIKDDVTYPPLSDFKKDWEVISPVLRDVLSNLSDEKLDSIFEMPGMPDMKMSYYELITFMTYREASIIGQIVLWRRLLGYAGIKYDE